MTYFFLVAAVPHVPNDTTTIEQGDSNNVYFWRKLGLYRFFEGDIGK
jgi:hypothetical protein